MNLFRRARANGNSHDSTSSPPDQDRRRLAGSIASLSGISMLGALAAPGARATTLDANVVKTVESIGSPDRPLALRHVDGSFAPKVIALGYWSAGDGGGGVFEWIDDPSFTEDDPANWGSRIRSRNGMGYWRRNAA